VDPAFVQQWAIWGPLVGILVGGVLGGLVQFAVTWQRNRHADVLAIGEVRRVEYLALLDEAHTLAKALNDLHAAISGRWQPDDEDHSPEAEEMRRRDLEGAEAIERLSNASDELGRLRFRVDTVANPAVSASAKELDDLVSEYIRKQFENGMFRAADAEAFRPAFEEARRTLTSTMRDDLRIDKLYRQRHLS
jgi:hypothetical protein